MQSFNVSKEYVLLNHNSALNLKSPIGGAMPRKQITVAILVVNAGKAVPIIITVTIT